ncbi:unnamed protein product, partial [Anisakis simplex]|uniref:Tyrosinase_Cu-bd domain-containing protein n=1 Tax=Anisakis simplex TaxID=6269 RepID=A0A0M3J3X7_ANISI
MSPKYSRNLGQEGGLMTEHRINQVVQQPAVEYLLAYTAPLAGCPVPVNFFALEYTHSNVHLWVGGNMKPPVSSSNDPIFFAHHSFIDFIWEAWRLTKQSRWTRESVFSPDLPRCADPQHFSWAVMRPFNNLINREGIIYKFMIFGLSNLYTDQLYRYAPRPTCTLQMPTCDSPYLFCDTLAVNAHCVSKIKLNGRCSGFEGLDACYDGVCQMGFCVPGPTPPPFKRPERKTTPCFNRDPCCERWALDGECRRNRNYMRKYCAAACASCKPSYDIAEECADRHELCLKWSADNHCNGRSTRFMQENCRSSCGFCAVEKSANCQAFPT